MMNEEEQCNIIVLICLQEGNGGVILYGERQETHGVGGHKGEAKREKGFVDDVLCVVATSSSTNHNVMGEEDINSSMNALHSSLLSCPWYWWGVRGKVKDEHGCYSCLLLVVEGSGATTCQSWLIYVCWIWGGRYSVLNGCGERCPHRPTGWNRIRIYIG